MKKLFMIGVLTAFTAAASLSFGAAGDLVNCCVKGTGGEDGKGKVITNCQKVTKAECAKAKGKVVKDCKECK